MKRVILMMLAAIAGWGAAGAQLTLGRCIELADENYPLIRQYDLVAKTGELNLSDINRGWLPRIGVYGQATVQNVVPSFPEALTDMMRLLGRDVRGLGHVQYKVGADLTQTVWDGGQSRAARMVERAGTEESEAALNVQMYAMHGKVMDLYFGILLLNEQMAQARATIGLLRGNLGRMESMVANGVAMQSDADMVEAQLLGLTQQLAEAEGAAQAYRTALELYIGEELDGRQLERPQAAMPADTVSHRPELQLYDSRLRLNEARGSAVESSVMPRVGVFAQAYYGYPGLNYFESMMNRNLSFNIVAGVKITWTIDAFYTRGNSRTKLALAARRINADRELFMFNSRVQSERQRSSIESLERVMADDARIVRLRENVRKAAESQLANGVIDTTALLSKITDEQMARLTSAYHEIQLLQTIYQLKHTLNQ